MREPGMPTEFTKIAPVSGEPYGSRHGFSIRFVLLVTSRRDARHRLYLTLLLQGPVTASIRRRRRLTFDPPAAFHRALPS